MVKEFLTIGPPRCFGMGTPLILLVMSTSYRLERQEFRTPMRGPLFFKRFPHDVPIERQIGYHTHQPRILCGAQ
jgi:hypothetical protein